MSDISLNDITSGYNLSKINDNFTAIENALNSDRLQIKGGGNTLNQELDMNGNKIINNPGASSDTETPNYKQLTDIRDYVENLAANLPSGLGWFVQNGAGAIQRTFQDKGRDVVSVLDFGADPTGQADSTQAFEQAATVCTNVFVPFGVYLLANAVIPIGSYFFSESPNFYTSSSVNSRATVLKHYDNADYLFSLSGNVCFSGLVFIGRNGAGNIIKSSDGTKIGHITFNGCSIFAMNVGIGGPGVPNYMGAEINGCSIAECGTGINNIVDSKIFGGNVSNNTNNGIYLGTGANDNVIVGTKIEWNGANNISFYGAKHNAISGCVIDRSGGDGISILSNSDAIISGCCIRRSCRDATANNSHVSIGNGCSVVISGVQMRSGADDDGTGNTTPLHSIALTGSPTYLSVTGSDLNGCTDTVMSFNGNSIEKMRIIGCPGIPDMKDRKNLGTISESSSGSATFYLSPITTYNSYTVIVRVTARNTSTGSIVYGEVPIIIRRAAGDAAATICSTSYETTSGVVGTSNEMFVISTSNVAVDGSSFEVSILNNDTSSYQITIECV